MERSKISFSKVAIFVPAPASIRPHSKTLAPEEVAVLRVAGGEVPLLPPLPAD